MACNECRELNTHTFRSADDLLHALQVAAAEADRGVLRRTDVTDRGVAEREALDSIAAANALPDALRYLFECTLCGERFELVADARRGSGAWTRQGDAHEH